MSDEPTMGDLPPDHPLWQQLADMVAVEREHSAVSGETRRKISRLADEDMAGQRSVSEDEMVERIFGGLSTSDLRAILADWLRIQSAV